MGVGIKLKEILRRKNMTIKQLAEITGLSVNTLYSITKRDSERVDEVILQRISEALGISKSELVVDSSAAQTQTFQAITSADKELLKLGGFSAISEFYNLSDEAQAEALKDIKGFVEYTVQKYKKEPPEDK